MRAIHQLFLDIISHHRFSACQYSANVVGSYGATWTGDGFQVFDSEILNRKEEPVASLPYGSTAKRAVVILTTRPHNSVVVPRAIRMPISARR
jgi:hypothetical protein